MGVDYTARRIIGFTDPREFKKLPKEVILELEEDYEVFTDGKFKGLKMWVNNYEDEDGFIAVGFQFQKYDYAPVSENEVPRSYFEPFEERGIHAEVLGFIEQW